MYAYIKSKVQKKHTIADPLIHGNFTLTNLKWCGSKRVSWGTTEDNST